MDKLTETIAVKVTPETAAALRAIAESEGQGVAEHLRHLIEQDIERARRQWRALNLIFGQEAE